MDIQINKTKKIITVIGPNISLTDDIRLMFRHYENLGYTVIIEVL